VKEQHPTNPISDVILARNCTFFADGNVNTYENFRLNNIGEIIPENIINRSINCNEDGTDSQLNSLGKDAGTQQFIPPRKFSHLNKNIDTNYAISYVSRDEHNKFSNYEIRNLLDNTNQSKTVLSKKNKNKNIFLQKIFFEQKKEEIRPYKIIINDYVTKAEYEVDNK
jgi:hypothetical protein